MLLFNQYPPLKIIQEVARKKKLKIFLIGGFLRDYLLGKPKSDFDFAVEKNAVALARQVARRVRGAFVLLDKEHGCARVVKKLEGEICTFDFADFRAKTFKSDLAHRDFTINTFAVDLIALHERMEINKVLLKNKKAHDDLRARKIKMTGSGTFKEDPLRMMRAFSLRAILDFKIEGKTLKQIKKDKDLLKGVSYERIRDEFFKILETERAAPVLKELDRVGLLERVIPQIRVMYNCTQGGYHHLDVWPHSLETMVQLEGVFKEFSENEDVSLYVSHALAGNRTRRSLIKLSALLHDIGKPQTREFTDGRFSFHGHENVGKGIVRVIARMLKLSTQERFKLEDLVQLHLRPGYLSNFVEPSQRMIYRFFRDAKDEAVSVLLMSLADQRSTRGPLTTEHDQKHHEGICLRLIKEYFDKQKEPHFERLISGYDLIKKLKLKPSPLFGKILSEIEEKQSLGKIKTKEEALQLARKIAKGRKKG